MYNEKIKASIYKYVSNNKEKVNEYSRNYMRHKYANNDEARLKHNKVTRENKKKKYNEDDEYRQNILMKKREKYHQAKLLKQME